MEAALWETMNTVGFSFIPRMALLSAASVAKSSADALSSKMRILGLLTSALAIVEPLLLPAGQISPALLNLELHLPYF